MCARGQGADGIVLRQLRGRRPPPYLSFELNSLAWLEQVAQMGYTAFKARRSPRRHIAYGEEGYR